MIKTQALHIIFAALFAGFLVAAPKPKPGAKPKPKAGKPKPKPKKPKHPEFEKAQWIWHKDAGTKAGTWYFRKSFEFPAGQKPKAATIVVTCDNLWTLHVNGKKVRQNDPGRDSWQRPQAVDVTKHLVIERNAIGIEGVNTIPGPSGLLVRLVVAFEDGKTYQVMTDAGWQSSAKIEKGWTENGFVGGKGWLPVKTIGAHGIGPWGKLTANSGKAPRRRRPPPVDKNYPKETTFKGSLFKNGVVFVSESSRLASPGQKTYVQFVRRTRAYFEMDPMTPAAIGQRLWSLVPFKPDGKKTLLYDAKGGYLGSPTVSYDGKTIYFSLAKKGEAYFHVWAVNPDGTNLRQITKGPFHDYDPVEFPDGRIAFSSTRLGSREEYHAKYASSIFACNKDGSKIRPITYHIVADREPRVTNDGSLVFIRMDNFLERAKVEVHLHQTRIDGSAGQVIIGPGRKGVRIDRDAAAEHPMNWLRKYGAGSPAPLPDGRVAAINQKGLVTSALVTGQPLNPAFLPYDLSPTPDGRLVCTSQYRSKLLVYDIKAKAAREIVNTKEMGVKDMHSIVCLAPRKRPPAQPPMIRTDQVPKRGKTGFLYCQNALNTQHTAADLKRIKAVRIYEGKPFTLEPTSTIYAHIGTIGTELGTVPLAEDGSFYVEVPADRPLAMQAVDGEGRAVINELSWIYTRPGEQRACVGCHAAPDAAPAMRASKALRAAPVKLLGQGTPHRFRANNGANGGLVNLQLDRFREVAAVNLHRSNPDAELSSVRRAGIVRDRSAVPALAKALNSKEVEVRCAAAISLSACGDRRAVPPLMAALKDGNSNVARAVANALEHLTGNPKGGTDWAKLEGALIARLSGIDKQGTHLALETLGHIGSDNGKKSIRDYLTKNPNDELRILMAAIRSLGYLQDKEAVPLLVKIMNDNLVKKGKGGFHETGFGQKPIYLSATSAEALGRIGGVAAEKAILEAFAKAKHFQDYNHRVGEHKWLMGQHSSVVHFRMLEALDRMQSKGAGPLVNKIIESIPADKDRGLLYELDSYERLTMRVVERSGRMGDVVEACLRVLGDKSAHMKMEASLLAAVSKSPHAQGHIRRHAPQARAAQVISVVCNDIKYAARIRKLLLAQRGAKPSETRAWCCFMLTRTLGRLGDKESAALFVTMLDKGPTEASLGLNAAPAHNVYKAWRPFHRPAAAWALGEMKHKAAGPVLLKVVKDLNNASSTREQAAIALGKIDDKSLVVQLKKITEEYPEIMTRRALQDAVHRLSR